MMATPLIDTSEQTTNIAPPRVRISPAKRLLQALFSSYAFLFFVFLYAPVLLLVIFSFNVSRFPTYWTGFTFDWYIKLFDNYLIGQALKNSLIVSITSTVISTIIGTMVSVAMERYNFRLKSFSPALIPEYMKIYCLAAAITP